MSTFFISLKFLRFSGVGAQSRHQSGSLIHKFIVYRATSLALDSQTPVPVGCHHFPLVLVKSMLPNSHQNIFGCHVSSFPSQYVPALMVGHVVS